MLVVIAALLATTAASPPDAPPAPQVEPATPGVAVEPPAPSHWYTLYTGKRFGLLADAGVPGGAGVAAMFRPWRFLRAAAGVSWNYLSFGFRGAVTFVPFEGTLTPTLHLEGGHFFAGDASRFSSNAGAKVVLRSVPEDYLSASIGLEIGSQEKFVFFVRAGLSWIRSEAQDIAEAIAAANPGLKTGVKSADNMPLLVQLPTVSVGIVLFLF